MFSDPQSGRLHRFTMRTWMFLLMMAACPLVAVAAQPVEDEAHRLDRLRTEQLNHQAAEAVARRDDVGSARQADAAQRDYTAARAAYQRRMSEWRARTDACMNGVYDACDRR